MTSPSEEMDMGCLSCAGEVMKCIRCLHDRVLELERQNEALRKSLKNYATQKSIPLLWGKARKG